MRTTCGLPGRSGIIGSWSSAIPTLAAMMSDTIPPTPLSLPPPITTLALDMLPATTTIPPAHTTRPPPPRHRTIMVHRPRSSPHLKIPFPSISLPSSLIQLPTLPRRLPIPTTRKLPASRIPILVPGSHVHRCPGTLLSTCRRIPMASETAHPIYLI
jgi:hypothetical protein